jgi:type I restriction enzyme S subunit
VNKLIKQLPKDWKWVKLGEVCDKMSNGANAKQSEDKIGFPISRIETIWNETIDLGRVKYIQENDPVFVEKYSLRKNDILFSHINSDIHLGKTAIFKNQTKILIHGINLLLIRLNQQVIPDFFNYQFKYKRRNGEFISIAQKSVNQSSINQPKLKNVDFVLPPKPTQLAIVSKIEELFSEIENGIKSLFTAKEQLKKYRQSVLKWAFEGKLTNGLNGDLYDLPDENDLSIAAEPEAEYRVERNHNNQANQKNHSSDKGELPAGWKWIWLKEVCEIKRGKSKHRPRNEPSLYGGKYPFIQTGDIRNSSGKYIKTYSQTYSEQGLQQSKLWPKGTLCITIAANIGETAILGFDACFPDSVVGLLCNEKLLLNKYTNYFFISFKQKLEELAPATAQKNINVDILEKVEIPLAPLKEQHNIIEAIESRLSVADKMEESITQSLQQAEALKQSILKKAFEGRLV